MKRIHVVGVLLWRGGLLLAAGYVLYRMIRFVLGIADPILELGVTLLIAGMVFVLISLIAERVADAKLERRDQWSD